MSRSQLINFFSPQKLDRPVSVNDRQCHARTEDLLSYREMEAEVFSLTDLLHLQVDLAHEVGELLGRIEMLLILLRLVISGKIRFITNASPKKP